MTDFSSLDVSAAVSVFTSEPEGTDFIAASETDHTTQVNFLPITQSFYSELLHQNKIFSPEKVVGVIFDNHEYFINPAVLRQHSSPRYRVRQSAATRETLREVAATLPAKETKRRKTNLCQRCRADTSQIALKCPRVGNGISPCEEKPAHGHLD